ncbi:MAG: TRAP transporter small permease subunit [Magnetococcales bacterium]|nr:TRAP transporter small permease subunit [Magnetococcales bacterium]
MVLVTFAVAMLRYLFDLGWIAMQESVTYMHAAVFMLGASYTLKHDGHVRVDIFYRPMSERAKAWINLFGGLFFLLPVAIFLFSISWEYVAASWSVWEGSREAGGLDGVWLLKSIILAMPLLIALQGLSLMFRNVLLLLYHEEVA